MAMKEEAKRREQGKRLKQARVDAGYRSAREAALSNHWPESTYRAHETGTRTIGQDDAERYAKRFRAAGARITARDILFDGHSPPFNEADELWTIWRRLKPAQRRVSIKLLRALIEDEDSEQKAEWQPATRAMAPR